ncbi:hypothetical protein E3N88_25819 [Mikania micrantha]|uniref:Uncharacterized protein n=1 Tax=Mikania micrantha TaxID=192012 RepID=A0A5N6N7E7_9ASTR|nr:hypothetical protein E3N88_25819 [Mikania micrantha]
MVSGASLSLALTTSMGLWDLLSITPYIGDLIDGRRLKNIPNLGQSQQIDSDLRHGHSWLSSCTPFGHIWTVLIHWGMQKSLSLEGQRWLVWWLVRGQLMDYWWGAYGNNIDFIKMGRNYMNVGADHRFARQGKRAWVRCQAAREFLLR